MTLQNRNRIMYGIATGGIVFFLLPLMIAVTVFVLFPAFTWWLARGFYESLSEKADELKEAILND